MVGRLLSSSPPILLAFFRDVLAGFVDDSCLPSSGAEYGFGGWLFGGLFFHSSADHLSPPPLFALFLFFSIFPHACPTHTLRAPNIFHTPVDLHVLRSS